MPVPKPRKGQSQSDFMGVCMHEVSKNKDRTNEQNVAICMDAWRSAHGGSKPKSAEVQRIIRVWCKLLEKYSDENLPDIPVPDPDEDREDFIDRCIDELEEADESIAEADAQYACEVQWEDQGPGGYDVNASTTAVVHKMHEGDGGMEFILSDATPDRFGDIVVPHGWQFANFMRNPIALFNHDSSFPIGKWKNVRVEDEALRGDLVLAPSGTSARIDELRRLIDAGILRAVSVGFKPIESKPRENQERGILYNKCELVETSLVSIPANPNALAIAKGLRISPDTQRLVFGEHADKKTTGESDSARSRAEHGSNRGRAIKTGEHAVTQRSVQGGFPMLLSKRIEAAEQHVVSLQDQLQTHLETVDDQNPDETAMAVTEDLTKKIADAERNRDNLKAAETRLAKASERDTSGGNGGTIIRTSGPRPYAMPAKKINPLDYLIRQGVVQMLAHKEHKPIDVVRRELYGEDECTKAFIEYTTKASSAVAQTAVTGWAAELVQQIYADFMEALVPSSVMPRLSTMGLALTFGRAGKVIIPTRNLTPSLAGSFVGEGMPIPVKQGAFATQSLVPKKLAVITTWTREMDEHSTPAIEGLLRDAVQQDTAIALDTVLLDANPATAIRPPGLRNGVSGQTATAGGGFAALVGDIKNLTGALLTATAGHIRKLVFIMNPQQILSISLIQPPNAATGLFPFADEVAAGRLRGATIIDSGTVPLGMVICLDAADFVSVGSEAPRFEVSDQATLHMEDTSPADITGGTPSPATPVKSMWQTDSMALRLIWPMNWALRRTGMVSWVSSVTW